MRSARPALLASLLLLGCGEKTVQQRGLSFRPVRQGTNQLWLAELDRGGGPVTLPFYYLPDETTDVALVPGLVEALLDPGLRPEKLWVSIDPDAQHYTLTAGAEIGRFIEDLGLLGGAPVGMAHSKPSQRDELPVVDCSQAGPGAVVILVEQGARNEVTREGHCVKASYHVPQDSLRVADRLCYGLAGVF
jgi:hypothetical protein